MILYTLLRLPHEIHHGSHAILLISTGTVIALIAALVAFVRKVFKGLANASLRNDLD